MNDEYRQRGSRQGARDTLTVPGVGFVLFKRAVDIVGALVGLVLTTPLMRTCTAWTKIVDPGPVLYRQWRVEHHGWLFPMYKLRTMRQNAEQEGAQFTQANARRILPGCSWMRRTHADELPQFGNILRRHMSLVGPRPERPEMVEQLRPEIPSIDFRHIGRPGLTGLAQLVNGYTNDLNGARRKVACDLRYLRHRSILGEIKLLIRTVPRVWDRSAM